jgi:hypothetical protein
MAIVTPLLISAGVTAGGMALQYLLAPKIKQEPVEKGKLDDIRITGSEYGAYIPRLWGKGRLGGNLIFSNGIQVYTIQTPGQTGGKGGPRTQTSPTTTYVYQTSVAALVGRGPVQNFLRIWADQDLFNSLPQTPHSPLEAENANLLGGAVAVIDGDASNGQYVTDLGNGGRAVFDLSGIEEPAEPPDPDGLYEPYTRVIFVYKCASSLIVDVDFDGVTVPVTFQSAADWTPHIVHSAGFADSLTFPTSGSGEAPDLDYIRCYKYYRNVNLPAAGGDQYKPDYTISGAVDESVEYPADVDDPSEYYNKQVEKDGTGKITVIESVPGQVTRFYTGTETQTQDSAIVAWLDGRYGAGEGALRTPAHRGHAYVVFENYTIKSGRGVPNFTFEVNAGNNTVNDVLGDLFEDVGLTASDYDVTATAALEQVGFVDHTRQSRRRLVEYLERYHLFRIAEIDGKIKTVLETATSSATIDADDLRAHEAGEEAPRFDAEIVLKEENLLPREVRVSVMNPNLEYHNETVPAQLFASLSGTESKEYSFPIVDTPETARETAEKLLLKEHAESSAVEFWGMPALARYAVGDVVTVPIGGVNRKIRIEKKQVTLPLGKIRFQGVTVNPFVPTHYQADFTEMATVGGRQQPAYNFPRNSVIFPFVSVPLSAAERNRLGVYLAVSGRGRGAGGAMAVYRETADENFDVQYVHTNPSVLGLTDGTLGGHGNAAAEDTTNTLDIWFFNETELETVTADDLAANPLLNLLRVGDEWIQFRTAESQTLEDNSPHRAKWRVSNLRRGRFYTEDAMNSHGADEYAALYTPALRFFDLDSSDIGSEITLKAVTTGQAEENGQTTAFTFHPIASIARTSNVTLAEFESGVTFTNTGAVDQVTFTLPAIENGLEYKFHVTSVTGLRVQAAGSSVIYLGDAASSAGGYAVSEDTASFLHLRAVAGQWRSVSVDGAWEIST